MTAPATSNRRSVYADRLREFPDFAFGDDAAFQNRGRWHDFFRRRIGAAFDGRVVLEVGCADGAFLGHIASISRHSAFVGLDWKAKSVYDAARTVAANQLRNIALIRGRGQDVAALLGDREADEVWVFHPDPCDRPAELNNRLIAEPFLKDVHRVLRDGGSLCLKTDHPGYYQWVLALFGLPEPAWFHATNPRAGAAPAPRVRTRELMRPQDLPPPSLTAQRLFRVSLHSPDFWNDPAALEHTARRPFAGESTFYERRFIRKRYPIYYVELEKSAGHHLRRGVVA